MGLSSISDQFKKAIVWVALGLVALTVIWVIWLLLSFAWKLIFPPPPLGPNIKFGSLDKPFVSNFDITNVFFELDTPGGQITTSETMLPVFVAPLKEGKLNSLDTGKRIASGANLDSEPQKLTEFEWRWTDEKNPNGVLKVNIVTGNYVYNYDWVSDSSVLTGIFKTNEEQIIKTARGYLSDFRSLQDELKKSRARVTYWRLQGQERNRVSSFSEANAVRVEIFRPDVSYKDKNYPMVEPNPNLASVNLLVSQKDVLEINFTFWDIDFNTVGTYPIKTGAQAYEDLKAGKALISTTGQIETLTIGEVYLAYLNPLSNDTRYVQPVYVFEGQALINNQEQDFQAYVLAINDKHIND